MLAAGQSIERLSTDDEDGMTAIDLTGNELGQQIDGNAGANILSGQDGDDALNLFAGDWGNGGEGADVFQLQDHLPGDPVARARVRLFLFNFEKELFVHVNILESRATKGNEKALEKARAHIRDRLTQLAPVFLKNKYMLGDNFSMLDVAIAPLLWRLDFYGIELSKNAAPLLKYAERIFSRPAYIEALTPSEKVMRK